MIKRVYNAAQVRKDDKVIEILDWLGEDLPGARLSSKMLSKLHPQQDVE